MPVLSVLEMLFYRVLRHPESLRITHGKASLDAQERAVA